MEAKGDIERDTKRARTGVRGVRHRMPERDMESGNKQEREGGRS